MSARRANPAGADKHYGFILIAALTVGFLAMAASVWWYYTRQLSAMEAAVVQELTAVSDIKTRQLVSWRNDRLGDGHVQMASPVIEIAARLLAGTGTPADRSGWLDMITRLQAASLYSGAVLTDLEGNARLAIGGPSPDVARRRKLAADAVAAKDVQLSDLALDSVSGQPLMALAIPVRNLGAIVLDIDPTRFLYPYLSAWPGNKKTAETAIVRPDGHDVLYLSELRFLAAKPLHFRRSISSLKVRTDLDFRFGLVLKLLDYRGAPVFGLVRNVPNTPWTLITKVDSAEADAPVVRLGWEMAILTTLIALVTATGAALVWLGQRAHILKEREARFHSVANETPAYLWMTSIGTGNSFINTPLAKYLGTDQTSLLNTWSDYLHPDDAEAAREMLQEALRTKSGYVHEFRIRRYDGKYQWAVSTALPRFSPDGVFLGFAGSLIDITERRLAEQKLREELAESTRKEQEIQDLSARLINAHEEERKRLAREMHDDLSQQIAALSIATGNLKRQVPAEFAEARAHSDRIHVKLVQLAADVRRMSHELHPAILQHFGLAPALRAYCEEFGALNGIHVSLEIQGSFEAIAPSTELCLFRVTQEAMRNVAKHAHVATASVTLRRAAGALHLSISDAGAGIEPNHPAKAGLGLLNIKERVRLERGKAEIRSAPGQGTTILVQVPDV